MKLFELFSRNPDMPMDQEEDINWLDDLKFYIDHNDELLTQYLFPAINKHKENPTAADAYKLYVNPLRQCAIKYCDKFETELPHKELFPTKSIIELAKHMADSQGQYIEKGDYE